WAHPEGFPLTTKIEIAGTSGLYTDQSQWSAPLAVHVGGRTPHSRLESPQPIDPYALELRHFIAAVSGSEPLRLGAQEAIASLRIALAALDPARSGEPVTLKTFAESAGGRG